MPIVCIGSATKTATLATTLLRIEDAAGKPRTGTLLILSWPAASQDAANLVRVRYGSGDDGDSVASDDDTIHPTPGYRVGIPIEGVGSVAIAGASAFAITARIV